MWWWLVKSTSRRYWLFCQKNVSHIWLPTQSEPSWGDGIMNDHDDESVHPRNTMKYPEDILHVWGVFSSTCVSPFLESNVWLLKSMSLRTLRLLASGGGGLCTAGTNVLLLLLCLDGVSLSWKIWPLDQDPKKGLAREVHDLKSLIFLINFNCFNGICVL